MIDKKSIGVKLIKITDNMLSNVSDNGAWGIKDYTDWGPIITVMTIDYLLACDMSIEDEWMIDSGDTLYNNNIKKSLTFLNTCISDVGDFGADFWDVCQLGKLIEKYDLQIYFPNYDKLKKYILDYITNNRLATLDTDWSGIGMYVAAIEYLIYIKKQEEANNLYEFVLSQQQDDGLFIGKKNKLDCHVIHPVWHTAQVARLMTEYPQYYREKEMLKIHQWLNDVQCNDGSFDYFSRFTYYYTCYGIIAYNQFQNASDRNINKAISFIINAVKEDGSVGDSGGTLMAAFAFQSFFTRKELSELLEQINYKREKMTKDVLRALRKENTLLKAQNSELNEKRASVELSFTKKEVWKLGIWITVIIFLIGIIIPIFLQIMLFVLSEGGVGLCA